MPAGRDADPSVVAAATLQLLAGALGFVARRLNAESTVPLLAIRDSFPVPLGLARFPVLTAGRPVPRGRRSVLDAAAGIPLALLELPRRGVGAGGADAGDAAARERRLSRVQRTKLDSRVCGEGSHVSAADFGPPSRPGSCGSRTGGSCSGIRWCGRRRAHAPLADVLSDDADLDRPA